MSKLPMLDLTLVLPAGWAGVTVVVVVGCYAVVCCTQHESDSDRDHCPIANIACSSNGYCIDRQRSGADPGFKKGGFYLVPKSDTGGATSIYL